MKSTIPDLNRILYLFEKSHQLSITRSEYEELKAWAELSPENTEIWNDFSNTAKREQSLVQWNAFNSDAALLNINSRIRKRSFRNYAAIAASVLLMLSVGLYFGTRKMDTTEHMVVSKDDILPGKNKAFLKFSDDQHIALREDKQGLQIGKNGITYQDGDLIQQQHKENQQVRQVTLSVPRAGKYDIKLEDGSHIWVNSATELKFPESFKDAKYREIELFGEAYFEVAHDAGKPFRVKMGEEVVEVLGTSFNLSNYDSEDFSKTTLLSGKVGIDINTLKGNRERSILAPGQQAVYNKLQKSLNISNVDVKYAVSWKNGDFMFENEHIASLMKQVERWYDVQVVYQGNFKNFYFSGIVSRSQPLSAVLDMLATTGKIKYTVNKDRKEVVLTTN